MFQGSSKRFQRVSRNVLEGFKGVSKDFWGFKGISRESQEDSGGLRKFQGRSSNVSGGLRFHGFPRVSQGVSMARFWGTLGMIRGRRGFRGFQRRFIGFLRGF